MPAKQPARLTTALVAAACLGFLPAASADQILLSNLPSNDGGHGEVSSTEIRGASFTTSTDPFFVNTVTLRLLDYISATDTALLTFRLDDNGAPSASIFASLTAPTSTSNDFGNFQFTAATPVALQAETLYWLVIAANSTEQTFKWARSNPSQTPTGIATFGEQVISYDSGSTWETGSNGPHSFAITGVPEPSLVSVACAGLIAVLAVARQRRRTVPRRTIL